MATKKEATDVAVDQKNELAVGGFEDYAGSGFENTSQDDYSIPFIGILQALSPQVQENDALRPGMIVNTVTGDVYESKTGFSFVPVTTLHNVVEFRPRDTGGGFVGVHDINSPVVVAAKNASTEYGSWKTPEGNELIETFNLYGMLIDNEGNGCEVVLAFSGSKIKKYKGFLTKAKMIQFQRADGSRFPAPLFAHRYRFTTVLEKNTKGNFFNWNIAFDGEDARAARLSPDSTLVQRAVSFQQLLADGLAQANYTAAGNDAAGQTDEAPF